MPAASLKSVWTGASPTDITNVQLPGGMSVVMRGRFTITGDARAGSAVDATQTRIVAWAQDTKHLTMDDAAEQVAVAVVRAVADHAPRARLARTDAVRVDAHDARYLVFELSLAESLWVTLVPCGDRLVQLTTTGPTGYNEMATMMQSFHCSSATH